MGLERDFRSDDPSKIKSALISLLDPVTEKDVLALDQEYQLAKNKLEFLADFETKESNSAPKRDPILFEKWTHYRWIRLELTNLAYAQAATNKISLLESNNLETISNLKNSLI